jgi:hypothetical protein
MDKLKHFTGMTDVKRSDPTFRRKPTRQIGILDLHLQNRVRTQHLPPARRRLFGRAKHPYFTL